jgi:hypothetical protein
MAGNYMNPFFACYPNSKEFLRAIHDMYAKEELELLNNKLNFTPPETCVDDFVHWTYRFNLTTEIEVAFSPFLIDFENLPLMINHKSLITRKIVAWRLEIGK